MPDTWTTWIIALVIALVIAAAAAVWLLNLLYLRGASDRAHVRTGFGGRKVTMDGGMFVLPILHRVTSINLGLSKVALKVGRENGLITSDRMRVDVEAEFFLRVRPDKSSVALAASTLGALANRPDDLAAFHESEFLGALRAVAAERSLDGLHEDRTGFVEAVRSRVATVLAKNGLEVSSVAVRNLDQTALEHFDTSNRFDAEGLTRLVEKVEERRRERNDIERKSEVSIRGTNLAVEKEILSLDQESELARLEQERRIEIKRASQAAEIARERAEREAEADAARIEGAELTSQREIAAKESVEVSRHASERALDIQRVQRERDLRWLEIERGKFVDLAKLQASIEVLVKSVEEAGARVDAEPKLTAAAKSSAAVDTAREVGAAQRAAAVSKVEIESETGAERARAAARAEAERLLNEAENVLTEDARAGRLRALLIGKLEAVIAETVKPIEKIDGIKLVHLVESSSGGGRSPTDEVIDSALRYRVRAPMIDELMKEFGIEGADISKMGDVMRTAKDARSIAGEAGKTEGKDD